MNRIAFIADVHGNLVALEAILAEVASEDVDEIINLGDVVANGAQPGPVADRLRHLGCPTIMGNTDSMLLGLAQGCSLPHPGTERALRILDVDLWTAEQLNDDDYEYMRAFQSTIDFTLSDATSVLCYHGSPRSPEDLILSTTSELDLDEMLEGCHADVLIGGHSHTPMLRRYRNMLLLNPGSVGLPYQRTPAGRHCTPSWAEYLVVDARNGSLQVNLRRIPIDVESIIDAIVNSGMPHAQSWVKEWKEGRVQTD